MICNLWDFVYAHSTSKEVHPTPWKHLAAIVTTVIIKLYIIDVYIYIYIIDEHISHAIVYQIIKLYKYVFIHIWSFLTCILYTTYYIILYIYIYALKSRSGFISFISVIQTSPNHPFFHPGGVRAPDPLADQPFGMPNHTSEATQNPHLKWDLFRSSSGRQTIQTNAGLVANRGPRANLWIH